MSTHRSFPEVTISQGGSHFKAMQITCCVCGAVGYYAFQTGSRRKPPIAAQQNFRSKGWAVGSSAKKDFCPEHVAPSSRREKPAMSNVTAMAQGALGMKAEPPRQMTREDRQIIHAKLSDVYDNGCYLTPWTDARVAADLGVPRAWVSELRDLMFGPENSNPAFDEFMARSAAIEKQQAAILENEKRIDDAIAVLRKQREKNAADFAELMMLKRRIEKELGR